MKDRNNLEKFWQWVACLAVVALLTAIVLASDSGPSLPEFGMYGY